METEIAVSVIIHHKLLLYQFVHKVCLELGRRHQLLLHTFSVGQTAGKYRQLMYIC